jgi:hypothetical protein
MECLFIVKTPLNTARGRGWRTYNLNYNTHLVASSGNTFAVCSCFLWVGFVAKWSVFHELGIGELRQVGHNRLIVHMRVRNFFRRDDLWEDIK